MEDEKLIETVRKFPCLCDVDATQKHVHTIIVYACALFTEHIEDIMEINAEGTLCQTLKLKNMQRVLCEHSVVTIDGSYATSQAFPFDVSHNNDRRANKLYCTELKLHYSILY